MGNFAFGKRHRLLKADDFTSVFSKTEVKAACPELLLLARFNSFDHPRLGVVVAKKQIKLASQRNRIKRLTRENFRLQQHRLLNLDIVVLVRKGAGNLDNGAYAALLQKQWARLIKRAEQVSESSL